MDRLTGMMVNHSDYWKGGAIGLGACGMCLGIGARIQSITGDVGVWVGLLLAIAVAAWYSGRLTGLLVTGLSAFSAAFFILPPVYSFRVEMPEDSAALYAFAIGGVVVSLVCGSAWRLRLDARGLRNIESKVVRLQASNASLEARLLRKDAALGASDRLIQTLTQAEPSKPSVRLVDCGSLLKLAQTRCEGHQREGLSLAHGSLPSVSGDERQLLALFQVLVSRAVLDTRITALNLSAGRLPDSWLFVARFERQNIAAGGSRSPLSELELRTCEWIVLKHEGQCSENAAGDANWEFRFELPAYLKAC